MLRKVGGVVLGYIVMAATVFLSFTAAWFVLGPDGAFRPGSYDVTSAWIAVSLVVGIVAALLGGLVARRVSRSAGAVRVLAALVFVLGLAIALPLLFGDPMTAPVRDGVPTMSEAMQQARTPTWVAFANAVTGAIGVLLGGGRTSAAARTW